MGFNCRRVSDPVHSQSVETSTQSNVQLSGRVSDPVYSQPSGKISNQSNVQPVETSIQSNIQRDSIQVPKQPIENRIHSFMDALMTEIRKHKAWKNATEEIIKSNSINPN